MLVGCIIYTDDTSCSSSFTLFFKRFTRTLGVWCINCLLFFSFSKSIQAIQICNQRANFSHSLGLVFLLSLFSLLWSVFVFRSHLLILLVSLCRFTRFYCTVPHVIRVYARLYVCCVLCALAVRQINRAKRKKKLHKIANLVFYTLDICSCIRLDLYSSSAIPQCRKLLHLTISSLFVLFAAPPACRLFLSSSIVCVHDLIHMRFLIRKVILSRPTPLWKRPFHYYLPFGRTHTPITLNCICMNTMPI